MRRNKYSYKILLLVVLIIFVFCIQCSKDITIPDSLIIVVIDDRVLTEAEFIRRVEYTIRPPYCQGNNNVHRKIVLNSLIAEKLLALEVDKLEDWQVDRELENYFVGRKEQLMRQIHYRENALNKVEIDKSVLSKAIKDAHRTYEIEYLSIENSTLAKTITSALSQGVSFDEVASRFIKDSENPRKEITWFEAIALGIESELYEKSFSPGDIIQPVRTTESSYLVMKILGWTDQVDPINSTKLQFYKEVENVLRQIEANKIYTDHLRHSLTGKSIVFHDSTFKLLVEELGEQYYAEHQAPSAINSALWEEYKLRISNTEIEGFASNNNQPLFQFNGEIWTMDMLYKLVEISPIVFREKKIPKKNFAEQVKKSVADLVRDNLITKEAYHLGYDKREEVRLSIEMWSDHYKARKYRNSYLSRLPDSVKASFKTTEQVATYLNQFVDSLQSVYSSDIRINIEKFKSIELTRIDMFAIEKNVPYPIIVPSFPILTTDHKLDYGIQMGY